MGDLIVLGSGVIFGVQTIAQKKTFPLIPPATLLFGQSLLAIPLVFLTSLAFEGLGSVSFHPRCPLGRAVPGGGGLGGLLHALDPPAEAIPGREAGHALVPDPAVRGRPGPPHPRRAADRGPGRRRMPGGAGDLPGRLGSRARGAGRGLARSQPGDSEGYWRLGSVRVWRRRESFKEATMDRKLRRRRFLQSASAIGLGAGLGDWAGLKMITPARAADLKVGPDAVRFRPEIEPVVRWIEETPRERALEVAIGHLKGGLSYRDLLAALFLAGIRNVKPHPVGFKFHAVLVINSAHLLGQTAAENDRLLPLLWASTTSRPRRRRTSRKGTGRSARWTRHASPGRAGPRRSSSGRWRPGTPTRPTRPSPRSAGPRGRPRPWSRSGAWGSAISATSATSPSSPRSAGGPCRPSAGSTPSRSSARWPSACSTSTAIRAPSPSGLTRPTSRTPARSATTGRPASPTRARPGRCWRRSGAPRRRRPRPRR